MPSDTRCVSVIISKARLNTQELVIEQRKKEDRKKFDEYTYYSLHVSMYAGYNRD